MTRWRACALALLGGLLAGAGRAGADADNDAAAEDSRAARKPPVVLDSSACLGVLQDELRHLIALELTPRRLELPGGTAEPQRVHARITCNAGRARLSVEDSARDKRQELELDLQETIATARTRLLALTLSELIATLDMELSPSGRAQAGVRPAQPDESHPQLSARTWRGRGWLGVGLAREGRPALLAPALHVGGLWYVPGLPLALSLDLLGSRGSRKLTEGSLSAWTFSGSAVLAARLRLARLELLLGAGLRVGYARLEGTTESDSLRAGVVSSGWWGPLVSAALLVGLHGRWGLRAALELAYVAKPVRGLGTNERTAYALEHLQLHAQLALSVGFQ